MTWTATLIAQYLGWWAQRPPTPEEPIRVNLAGPEPAGQFVLTMPSGQRFRVTVAPEP